MTLFFGQLDLEFGNNTGSGAPNRRSYRESGLPMTLNQWHHIAITITNLTTHKLYIDGQEFSIAYRSGTANSIVYQTDTLIGSRRWVSKSFAQNCFVDDYSIFSGVLSQSNIQTLAANCPLTTP
jgi:hypothetical protein